MQTILVQKVLGDFAKEKIIIIIIIPLFFFDDQLTSFLGFFFFFYNWMAHYTQTHTKTFWRLGKWSK